MCPSRVIFLTGCLTFVLMLPARLLCFPTLEDRLALVGEQLHCPSSGQLQIILLQSGASSQAKHGGAYFSAVYGSIEDPLAAPGPYENLGPPFLGGSAQPVTFVLPLTHTQLPLINGHSSRICSEAGLMYLFGDKYIRPVPEQILLQCPLRSGSSVCMCEGEPPCMLARLSLIPHPDKVRSSEP